MDGAPLEMQVTDDADLRLVAVAGEVDLSNSDRLRSAVLAELPEATTRLLLDLTETSYLDSSGIRALFQVRTALDRAERRLGLVVPLTGHVRTVLEITGVAGELGVRPTRQEALDALQGAP